MEITCPLGDAILTIEIDDCPFEFSQVQGLALQRQFDDTGARNSFTFAEIKVKANWDTKADATDSTRIQYTPLINNPQFTPGDVVTEGSGNEVPDGIARNVGIAPTLFTAEFIDQHSHTARAMKGYKAEKLQIYLFNLNGDIGCAADDDQTPTICYGLPIRSWNVKPRHIRGFGATDKHDLSFALPGDWDDYFIAVTPTDFDPRQLLNDPT